MFDLRDGYNRSANVNTNLHDRRHIETPAGWQIISRQCRSDNYKALKPHPDIDEDGHEKSHCHIPPDFLRPEQLRR